MKAKVLALVDCNNFFCSCERLFRPDLLKVPVGVLSNNDGCFVSRSEELKELGVAMGDPYFKVKEVCDRHKVAVFSANFSLYTNISNRVMSVLSKLTPNIEIYSVDEAFMDISGFSSYGFKSYGLKIRHTVERQTGIPVSVGLAPTKVLAKIANFLVKKSKGSDRVLCLLDYESQTKALVGIPVEEIWGIGRKSAKKLRLLGIKTAKDFRDFSNTDLILKTLTSVGRKIQDELRGITCFELNDVPVKKKGIISSRSFGEPVSDLVSLSEAVATFATLATEKLRKQESICSQVDVWINSDRFDRNNWILCKDFYKFNGSTSDTRKIVSAALRVLRKIYKPGYKYKKVGVALSFIRDREYEQFSFFEESDTMRSQMLMSVTDFINSKDGPMTLKLAVCGLKSPSWKARRSMYSPRYLSGWSELRSVK